eukprot:2418338-Rhodomonas_salina.1
MSVSHTLNLWLSVLGGGGSSKSGDEVEMRRVLDMRPYLHPSVRPSRTTAHTLNLLSLLRLSSHAESRAASCCFGTSLVRCQQERPRATLHTNAGRRSPTADADARGGVAGCGVGEANRV